jgi:hypothetical protein
MAPSRWLVMKKEDLSYNNKEMNLVKNLNELGSGIISRASKKVI